MKATYISFLWVHSYSLSTCVQVLFGNAVNVIGPSGWLPKEQSLLTPVWDKPLLITDARNSLKQVYTERGCSQTRVQPGLTRTAFGTKVVVLSVTLLAVWLLNSLFLWTSFLCFLLHLVGNGYPAMETSPNFQQREYHWPLLGQVSVAGSVSCLVPGWGDMQRRSSGWPVPGSQLMARSLSLYSQDYSF